MKAFCAQDFQPTGDLQSCHDELVQKNEYRGGSRSGRSMRNSNSLSERGRTHARALTIEGAICTGRPCDRHQPAQLRARCRLGTVREMSDWKGSWPVEDGRDTTCCLIFPRNCIVKWNEAAGSMNSGVLVMVCSNLSNLPSTTVRGGGGKAACRARRHEPIHRECVGKCRQPDSRR